MTINGTEDRETLKEKIKQMDKEVIDRYAEKFIERVKKEPEEQLKGDIRKAFAEQYSEDMLKTYRKRMDDFIGAIQDNLNEVVLRKLPTSEADIAAYPEFPENVRENIAFVMYKERDADKAFRIIREIREAREEEK